MEIVALSAIGVGGATVFGSVVGFLFKKISHKFSNTVMSFAAGVMLAAAILGLILPALGQGGVWGIFPTVLGIFAGARCLDFADKLVPHLHKLVGAEPKPHGDSGLDKVILFVLAIAIHNLPEGIAAGVGFGTEDTSQALMVAVGIAVQNIPEGMVIIGPMLAAGISPKRTLLIGTATGIVEVLGTFLGYFAISVFSALLPFALGFAGGTMLYVIGDEMIPDAHSHGNGRSATYSMLVGFCAMLFMDVLVG